MMAENEDWMVLLEAADPKHLKRMMLTDDILFFDLINIFIHVQSFNRNKLNYVSFCNNKQFQILIIHIYNIYTTSI